MKKLLILSIFSQFTIFQINAYGLTLKDAFELALKNDIEIQLKENSLKKIRYDLEISKGLLYPTIDLRGDLGIRNNTSNSLTPNNKQPNIKEDQYELILKQPIFDGKNATFEEKLQHTRYISAQYYLKEAQNLLSLNFSESYLNALKAKDAMTLQAEAYQISDDIFQKVSKKVERGFGTRLEFEEAKGQVEESNLNLTVQKLNYRQSIENLKKFLQKDFDINELVKPVFAYNIPDTEEDALNFALTNHPSMLVSLSNVEVALYENKRDKKAFLPNVNAYGKYIVNNAMYKESVIDESNEYKVGIEIAYNLYRGGQDNARDKKSIEYINEKKIMIEKSKQQITNKLALAWNSYKINREKLHRLKDFLETRKYILEATIKEFDLGTKSLTNVFDAHNDYISTKRNMIDTSYDFLFSQYRVIEAMGILSDNILSDKRNAILNNEISSINHLLDEINDQLKYSYTTKEALNDTLPQNVYEESTSINTTDDSKISYNQLSENLSFKEKFLNADSSKYTINLATALDYEKSIEYIKSFSIEENSFSFEFGVDIKYYKIMYGIYDTYDDAKIALDNLDKKLLSNNPRIENITIKQNLYHKYNNE